MPIHTIRGQLNDWFCDKLIISFNPLDVLIGLIMYLQIIIIMYYLNYAYYDIKSYTYHIRHDLCNLCHCGMPSEVLHLYKLLLHEVRKLFFVVICDLYKLFC